MRDTDDAMVGAVFADHLGRKKPVFDFECGLLRTLSFGGLVSSDMMIPTGGEESSATWLLAQMTRTEPGGFLATAASRNGIRSSVKRNGPRQFVSSCSSMPCFDTLPSGVRRRLGCSRECLNAILFV